MHKPHQKRPPTIKDVAKELGVSIATVSRALVHPHLLNAETRQRVLEAIDRLGYQPNLIARDLRRRKSGLAFVVVPSLSPVFLEVFAGAERAAREVGYAVLMGHTARNADQEHLFLDQVASGRADGIILVTSAQAEALAKRTRATPPVVAVLERVEGARFPTVRIDHVEASKTATRHLLDLGHRRIAHIAGPAHSPMAVQRREGFEMAMRQAGLDPAAYPVLHGDFTAAFGETAMETLLSLAPRPTAVFAGDDEMGVGAMHAIRRHGLAVGRDVSVIGCDDQPVAGFHEPSLTTIKAPMEEMGYCAMLTLERLVSGAPHEIDMVLPTRLLIRATTGPVVNA